MDVLYQVTNTPTKVSTEINVSAIASTQQRKKKTFNFFFGSDKIGHLQIKQFGWANMEIRAFTFDWHWRISNLLENGENNDGGRFGANVNL